MKIKTFTKNNSLIIAIESRVDTNTSIELKNVLIPLFEKSNSIELDFSKVSIYK